MFQPIKFVQADILHSNNPSVSGNSIDNRNESDLPDGKEVRTFYEDLTTQRDRNLVKVKLEAAEFCSDCQIETCDPDHKRSTAHLLSLDSTKVSQLPTYVIPESNRGYQLMLKTGWDEFSGGLGADGQGRKYPVKTILKRDRVGLGAKSQAEKPRVTHFAAFDTSAVEKPKVRQLRSTTQIKRTERRKELRQKQREIDYRRQFSEFEIP